MIFFTFVNFTQFGVSFDCLDFDKFRVKVPLSSKPTIPSCIAFFTGSNLFKQVCCLTALLFHESLSFSIWIISILVRRWKEREGNYHWNPDYTHFSAMDSVAAIAVSGVFFGLFVIVWIGSMCYFKTPCKDIEKETHYIEEGNLE